MAAQNAVDNSLASQPVRAVVCMLIGVSLLALNDGLVKSLTVHYPTGQILFIRGLFVLPWILLLTLRDGGLHRLRINNFRGQSVRAVCVIASSFLFVSGLVYLPLADAIAAAFTGPLFITAMAPIMLGERVGWRRWLAVIAGFVGVIFMVRPGTEAIQWAILFPLGAALFGGMRDLITRRISRSETSVAVLLVTTSVVMFAGLTTAPFGWEALSTSHLWKFAASGLLVACSHYLMIEAFRLGEAAMVAPFKYSSVLWGVLFGYLLFGDLPDLWTLTGAAIVIIAGLYILRREMLLNRGV